MCPKVSCTPKDLPYEARLRDRRHHSWPSIPLSLTWVFRRDTPLKLAIRGGHIKRDRQPAGCPSVSVQSTHVVKFLVSFSFTSKLLLEKKRFDYNRNISFPLKHEHFPQTSLQKHFLDGLDTYHPWVLVETPWIPWLRIEVPSNISSQNFNAIWFLPCLACWLMMTKRLTSMSVPSAWLPGALIEAQTKKPNFTWKTFNVSFLLTPSKLPQHSLL